MATAAEPLAAGLQAAIAAHKAGRLSEAERLYRDHLAGEPQAALALSNLGQIVLERGDAAEALTLLQRAIASRPRFANAHAHLGNALAALGKLNDARSAFDQALAINRNCVDALAGLAAMRQRQGDIWDSLSYWQRAADIAPQRNEVRHNLATALSEAGRHDEAVSVMETAVAAQPSSGVAHSNFAAILNRAGRFEQAVAAGRRAIDLAPNDAGAHYNLAVALIDSGDHAGGIASLQRALAIKRDHVDALTVMGMHHRRSGDNASALACFRIAEQAEPRHTGVLLNIGATLLEDGRRDEALATYRHAMTIDDKKAEILVNLGATLEQLERFEEALEAYRLAITLEPDSAAAHFNYGLALLTLGRFKEGWPEYEWRQRLLPQLAERNDLGSPRWRGEPLSGRCLYVHAEQGSGDTMQFCRYLPMLRKAGATVIFECQPALKRLIEKAQLADRVVSRDEPPHGHDLYAPLLSLPGLLGTSSQTIPAGKPYFHADAQESEARRRQLAGLRRPLIGIAWQGNPQYKADRRRSVPLAMLASALASPAHSLVSLQVGYGCEQIAGLPEAARPFDPFADQPAKDFAATAAVVANLDVVVTIDSAIAHLAGAMGRPVFVLLPHVGDWRWLRGREDSAWYPTMRLFRQHRPGDWSYAFARLAEALKGWR